MRLELELVYYDSAVHRFNHYAPKTSARYSMESLKFIIVYEA